MMERVYNPLNEDFTVTYDVNGDGVPVSYTVHALEINKFPKVVADHIKHHLAYKIAMTHLQGSNYEIQYKKALEEVSVDLD